MRGNKYIRKFLADVIENKEDWYRRRIVFAYNNLSIESRNLSAIEICRKASIGEETYRKYCDFFEGVVRELKASTTK